MKTKAVIFLLFLNLSLYAQSWQNLTNKDWVFDISEDNTYLWIGTSGGLVRMDKNSRNTETFYRADKRIPDNNVLALEIEGDKLWLGSRFSGIGLYTDQNCITYNTLNTNLIYDNYASAIKPDSQNGTVYVSTLGNVSKFDGKNFEIIKEMDILAPFETIYDIETDNMGNVWMASLNGLYKYDGNQTMQVNEVVGNNESSIVFDSQKSMWVSSDSGLYKFSNGTWTCFNTGNSSLTTNNLFKMVIDKNDNLWIGAYNYLIKYSPINGFTNYECNNQQEGKFNISTVYLDHENNLWIGTRENGLMLFDNGVFEKINYTNPITLPSNNVNFLQTSSGKIWFGYENGLFNLEGERFDTLNSGLIYPEVNLKACDNNGNIWFTNEINEYTSGGMVFDTKLIKFNGTGFEEIETPFHPLKSISLKIDKNNIFWFLVPYLGVYKWDGSTWTNYNLNNSGLTSDVINVIDFDSKGNIWFGQNGMWDDAGLLIGGGLIKFDGKDSWTEYNVNNSGIPYNTIKAIKIDPNDVVWLGTVDDGAYNGGGLTKFDGQVWNSYNTDNSGISDNQVIDIIEDKEDNLWCGSAFGGLIKFDKQNNWDIYMKQNSGIADNYVGHLSEKDKQIWMGHNIYTGISVLDKNGSGISTNNPNNNLTINIYPNPVFDNFVIECQLPEERIHAVNISDLSGKAICQKEYNNGVSKVTINSNEFNKTGNAVLILEVMTNKKRTTSKLIISNK